VWLACLTGGIHILEAHTLNSHTRTYAVCLCVCLFCVDQPHVWEEMWAGAEVAVSVKWEGGPGFGPWWSYGPYCHVGAPGTWARTAGISLLFVNVYSGASAFSPSEEAIAVCSLVWISLYLMYWVSMKENFVCQKWINKLVVKIQTMPYFILTAY
jgi:hypothetical protein